MTATFNIYTGAWFGAWPTIGTQFDEESVAFLLDLHDLVESIDIEQSKNHGGCGSLWHDSMSVQRKRFTSFLWDLLDAGATDA